MNAIICVGVSSVSSSECSNISIVSIVLHHLRAPSSRGGRAEQTTAVGARPAGVRMWEAVRGSQHAAGAFAPSVTLPRGPRSGSRSICVGVRTNHGGGFGSIAGS